MSSEKDRPAVHRATFRLEVLGSFSLTSPVCSIDRLPKKTQGLLAYLAVHRDRPISREQLAALLWGHSDNEHARRSLRQCLLSLRAALKSPTGDLLVDDASGVRLATHQVEIDLAGFETLARSMTPADLEAAQPLYRDELVAGLQIASKPFADWLLVQRRRLATAMSDVLFRLAVSHAIASSSERATAVAERLTVFDPLREDGHRLLMRLLAKSGRRSAALQKHVAYVQLLRRELGVAPDPATLKLAEAIQGGDTIGVQSLVKANSRPADMEGRPESGAFEPVAGTPDKASIAVLPFVNLSGDPAQNYFADGTAEDITIALGHVPWLFVIASSSSFTYRDHGADVRPISAELGVRYVLRGSVRKEDERVRIVVQLVDASRGSQVWAGRFEGDLHEIFTMQDRVATQVAAIVAPTLRSLEIERVQRKRPESLTAYDLHLRALACFRASRAGNQDALAFLARAIDLDPSYGPAYGLSARCYHLQTVFGWALPLDSAVKQGLRLAHRGAEIGKDDSETLWMVGHALAQVAGDYEYGVGLIDKSLALNPNSASAWISSCFVRAQLGDTDKALQHFAHAQRLNPRDSMHHVQWHAAALAHFVAGRHEKAADAATKALKERPAYPPPLRLMISICGLRGRIDEGRAYIQRLLAVNPDATIARLDALWQPSVKRNQRVFDQYLEGLRLAGMPVRR
jgi:TolB-like protein/Flp pilus assembly protein TadD